MLIILFGLFIITTYCQIGTPTLISTNVTLNIFEADTLSPYPEPTSNNYPKDSIVSIEISSTYVYTLESSNIVQVFNKLNLTVPVQVFADYLDSSNPSYDFVYLSVNQMENLLTLTSYVGGLLKHLVFVLQQGKISSLHSVCGDISISTAPQKVIMLGENIYSYLRSTTNDSVHITNSSTNVSSTVTLNISDCSIAASPDRKKALVWTRNSVLYVYSIGSLFSLERIISNNYFDKRDHTTAISISSDSQLAIIETDDKTPVNVVNITSSAITGGVNISEPTIQSTAFLDAQNRFILVEGKAGVRIYDLQSSTLSTLSGSFPNTNLLSDPSSGLLLSISTSSTTCYGINITDGVKVIASYIPISLPVQSNSTNTTNATNITNTTTVTNVTNTTNATNITNTTDPVNATNTTVVPVDEKQNFILVLNYTQLQNQTMSFIGDKLISINEGIQQTFSVVFSSPLAVQFLSLFNYFMLSSLYVLLSIRIPEKVFYYFSLLYSSCSSNFFQLQGFAKNIPKISEQRVTDARARYFMVSSDLLSVNAINLLTVAVNMVLFEVAAFLIGKGPQKLKKIKITMVQMRVDIYWGLIVSNMIPLLLAWKYSSLGGSRNYLSKINLTAQYYIVVVLAFLVAISFEHQLRQVRKGRYNRRVRTALRQWWVSYQNFIYPLLLFYDPLYFMSVIGVSNLFSLYNSLYTRKRKFFAIIKTVYPLVFHSCFFIFMFSTDNLILTMATMTCLITFLLGSVHHILQTTIMIAKFLIKFLTKTFCKTKSSEEQGQIEFMIEKSVLKKIDQMRVKKKKMKNKHSKVVNVKEILSRFSEDIEAKQMNSTEINKRLKLSRKKNDKQARKKVKTVKGDNADKKQLMVDWISKAKVTLVFQ